MASFNNISIRFSADLKEFSSSIKNAQRELDKVGKKMQNAGKNLTIGLTAPIVALGVASLRTFANFEQGLAKVQAISGATDAEMQSLRQSAEDLGASTRFAATEVATLQLNLSKLGFNPIEILKATEGILDLAVATGEDLAQSATVAASTIRGFGLSADEAGRVADVMAKSFSSSALDLTKFQTAMATVAPVAESAGQSLESTTGMLSVLVNAGLDASTAGTGLRNIFLDLAKSGMTMEEAFASIENSTNKNATAMDLFGKRGATVATVLAKNADQAADFTKQYLLAEGSAKKMAAIMGNTLEGSMIRLKSAMEGAAITIGEVLAPFIRKAADFAAMLASKFKELSPSTKKIIVVVAGLAAALGPVLLAVGLMATTLIPALISGFALLTGPIGLVIAAIAGIAFVIFKYWDPIKKALTDFVNYFIDLYNESLAFRVIVEGIIITFKTLWNVVRVVFDGIMSSIEMVGRYIKDTFTSVGEVFSAILKGDFAKLPGIISKGLKKPSQNLKTFFNDLGDDVNEFSTRLADDVLDSVDRIKKKEKIQFISSAKVEDTDVSKVEPLEISATAIVEATGRSQVAKLDTSGLDAFQNIRLVDPTEQLADSVVDNLKYVREAIGPTLEDMERMAEVGRLVGNEVAESFENFTGRFVDSLGLANEGMQGFLKGLINTVTKLISMMLAQAISQSIAGATASGAATGPAAVFTTPAFIATAVGGVLSAFAAIPKFADGGIVSGTTLGIMGEYSGAKNNPEVIAPLDKLKGMLSDVGPRDSGFVAETKLRGQDLLVSINRASAYKNRRG